MKLRRTSALTLMELLVVIGVLSLLIAILMPAMRKSREAGRRAVCMSNLKSTGQALHTYANNNEGLLVPGNSPLPWDVWGGVAESEDPNALNKNQQVNLGYLLVPNEELPMPCSDNHVFFCPSMWTPERDRGYKRFANWWGKEKSHTPIGYMFNNALDGFTDYVENAETSILIHGDRANFLLGDGSVHFLNLRPMVFDQNVGPETIQEVCARYNASFPTIMLHNWFERGQVDLFEAREYLNDPQGWATRNATLNPGKPVHLAAVAKKSLVADVVGGWGGGERNRPGGEGMT